MKTEPQGIQKPRNGLVGKQKAQVKISLEFLLFELFSSRSSLLFFPNLFLSYCKTAVSGI